MNIPYVLLVAAILFVAVKYAKVKVGLLIFGIVMGAALTVNIPAVTDLYNTSIAKLQATVSSVGR
jgi:hypothetical protein